MYWNLRPPLPAPVKARSAVMHANRNWVFCSCCFACIVCFGKTVVHESLKLLLHVSFHLREYHRQYPQRMQRRKHFVDAS